VGHQEPPTFPTATGELASIADAGLSHSVVPEQLPRLDAQSLRDPRDVVDRHVALRALDAAEVGPVDPALVRKRLLAQPARGAQPAHVLRQHVARRRRQSSISAAISAVTASTSRPSP
jgi:hypothetical protein